MKKFNEPIELIIQSPVPDVHAKAIPQDIEKVLEENGINSTILTKPTMAAQGNSAKAMKATKPASNSNTVAVRTDAIDTEINPWDVAHLSANALGTTGAYVEPNFTNELITDRKIHGKADTLTAKSFSKAARSEDDYDPDWMPKTNSIWHLDDKYSQLKSARDSVLDIDYTIRIGHIDTGFSATHKIVPDAVRNNPLQRNFIKGEKANDAHDPNKSGLGKNPGHGTGTLGILAGGQINITTSDGVFNDYLGGAHFAEIVSCRIAESVILLKTNAFAEALNYLTALSKSGTQIHVVSMSMGGAPSKIWADAVNAAYEAGITVVTAAGNNFGGFPTRHVIYPARFDRVIAACGVTHDKRPYWHKKLNEMQGCYGPRRHMDKALSAFTPNTPWAVGSASTISFSGAGTSSATPQIAAAAAIYYRKHHAELDALEPWQRVEAVRNALFSSALKSSGHKSYDRDFSNYFGNGIIQAKSALAVPVATDLPMTPKDEIPWFPILNTIFKAAPSKFQQAKKDMMNTELAQLVFDHPELRQHIDNDESDFDLIPKANWNAFREAVIAHPDTSVTLSKYLEESTLKNRSTL